MEYGKWRTDESKLETRVRISKLIEGQDMQTRQDKTRQVRIWQGWIHG
jgi:hypothetical protein